jgi:ribosomal protein S17
MLGSSSQTLQSINEEAHVLEARVVQTQMENEAKMARQRDVFEQKLKSQEDRSRAVMAANQRLSGEIAAIQANISALQHQAQDVQAASEIMRSEMNILEDKLARGREFLLSSLKSLDDSRAPQLAVLQELKTRHRLRTRRTGKAAKGVHQRAADTHSKERHVAEVTKQITFNITNDKEPDEVSFLSLGVARMHRASQPSTGVAAAAGSTNDVVNILGQKVTALQQEEHLSEAKLKVIFLTNFKAGVKRYAALLSEQRTMITTRKTLLAQQAELRVADEHLQAIHSALQQQLRSFGLFTQKLTHLALAPTREAPELLRHLPADVEAGMK